MARVPVTFTLNGSEQSEFVEAGAPLADMLRDKFGLTATKVGCAQGTCGACSILVGGELKLSCLIPAGRIEGFNITTLEGLTPLGGFSALQRHFADGFAAQCGFCTSGMIVAASALLAKNPAPDREAVVDAISGNICRCTGYEPIINAILAAAADMRQAKSV